MKIGLQTFKFNYPDRAVGAHLTELAQLLDQLGFADLWLVDHFFQMEGVGLAEEEMLEAYTTLGYFAGVTKNIRLGTLVTGVIYRNPALLVKTVTTLDVLSNGRAWLGIGAAWYEREARGLGFPFPPLRERFEQLEETLQIAHQMFAGDRNPYHGKHYHLAEPINSPRPINKLPILIGGMGEQKTLRLVAKYGDACNFDMDIGLEQLQHKLNVLRGHCEAIGRDYQTIEKTVVGTMDGKSSAELIDWCGQLAAAGFQHAIFNMPRPADLAVIETFGQEVIPAVATF